MHFQTVQTDVLFLIFLASFRLSDSGEDAKVKRHAKSWRGGKKRREKGKEPPLLLSPVSSRFIFVFVLSQFSGLDYLGAWNRLQSGMACNLPKRTAKKQTFKPHSTSFREVFFERKLQRRENFFKEAFLMVLEISFEQGVVCH